jgi:hypothetical protein
MACDRIAAESSQVVKKKLTLTFSPTLREKKTKYLALMLACN